MAIDNETRMRLTGTSRQRLDQTERKTSPAALRAAFGPRLLLDAADESNPYPPEPVTTLGRSLQAHAQRCERAWTSIHDSHYRSLADRSVDPGTAYLRSARAAQKQLKDLDAQAHQLLDEVGERLKWIDTVRANALKPPASVGEAQIDAEVRALIRAEKNPTKQAQLAAAHPRAVATAPAIASGLPEDSVLRKDMVDTYLRAVEPALMAECDEMQYAIEQFDRAGKSLDKLTGEVIDFELAAGLERGAAWQSEAA